MVPEDISMAPLAAALSIVGIFVVMGAALCYPDGLKVFAPKSSDRLAGSVQHFRLDKCRRSPMATARSSRFVCRRRSARSGGSRRPAYQPTFE